MVEEDFGDFEEINEAGENPQGQINPEAPARVRRPREGEVIGVILQRLGGNKMEVHCADGKKRNCRVPGRYSRSLWLRPKDTVLVKPWEFDNSKGDVIFKYDGNAVSRLRKMGMLDNIKDEF